MTIHQLKVFDEKTKIELLGLFVKLCEKNRFYERELTNYGLNAFNSTFEFQSSFCPDASDHHLYMMELGKETIGSPDGKLPVFVGNRAKGYRSQYLANLVKLRDEENGVDFETLRRSPSREYWRLELDQCSRSRAKMEIEAPAEVSDRWKVYMDMFTSQKKVEASLLCDQYSPILNYGVEEKFDILRSLLTVNLNPLGFFSDERRTFKRYPLYAKKVTEKIDLCCGIKNPDNLMVNMEAGSIDLVLHFRIKGFNKAKVEKSRFVKQKDDDKFLIVDYCCIVPYFKESYSQFHSMEELELNVLAQVKLLGMVLEDLGKIFLNLFGTPNF